MLHYIQQFVLCYKCYYQRVVYIYTILECVVDLSSNTILVSSFVYELMNVYYYIIKRAIRDRKPL